MKLGEKVCDICQKKYQPYSGNQKVCNKKTCQKEYQDKQKYKHVKYKFTEEFVELSSFSFEDIIDYDLFCDVMNKIRFENKDIEKV